MSVKNVIYVKKNCIWIPATCGYQHGKYLASIMDDPAITCDEVIEEQFQQILIKKKQPVERKISIFYVFTVIW